MGVAAACAPLALALALALLPYQTSARPCKRKPATLTGEAPGSAAQRSAARSHYTFQTMSLPAPLGRREYLMLLLLVL